jgi:hypothetical protein
LVVVVVLVIGGAGTGAYFLLQKDSGSTGSGSTTPIAVPTDVPEASIDFDLKQVTASTIGSPRDPDGPAEKAAEGVRDSLAQYFEQAFLTQENWDKADYAAAWASFVPESRQAAASDESLLTLGPEAPGTYSAVGFDKGDVTVEVLVDQQGKPRSAIAGVHFNATAKEQGGGTMAVRSVGRYFLRPEGPDWSIYGYQVRRKDKEQ